MVGYIIMELGTQLQLEFNNSRVSRAGSLLVGMKKGQYLIVELPEEYDQHNRQPFLEPGNTIIIRYINSRGIVYGVKSHITKTIYSPVKLMIVDYPKVIENHKLRKIKRSSCLLHSYVDVDNLLIEGYVLNISSGGCCASVDVSKVEVDHFRSGKDVSLSMEVPGIEDVVSVEGVIRNVNRVVNKYMVGIQFNELKPKTRKKIDKFLKTLEDADSVEDDFATGIVS